MNAKACEKEGSLWSFWIYPSSLVNVDSSVILPSESVLSPLGMMVMVGKVDESSVDELSSLWQAACEDYANVSEIAITDGEFPKLSGFEELAHQLDVEETSFQNFRMKKRPLLHTMQSILAPFESWGDLIGTVASAAFPPASSIMGAMLLLIRGARKVSESFDMIIDLFQKLSNFAVRLDMYKGVPLSKGMKVIIVKVLVNFLRVCAVSQKLLKTGSFRARLSKWAKNILIEDTSVSSLLNELQELTDQEKMMITAQNLNLTNQALKNTTDLLEKVNIKSDQDRLDRVKNSLHPVSASNQVRSAIMSSRLADSGMWVEQRIKTWWQSSQPILWLHGGPAVGKSYLAAKIIDVLTEIEAPPMSAVASFFFKNNDVDLRSINKALRTLAWQVAAQLPKFAEHAEDFCLKADPADTYSVWRNLFLKFLTDNGSNISMFFVIDGIDEADPEEQDILFSLLEKTYSSEEQVQDSAHLRFVLLSRDSVRSGLEEHSLDWVPEVEISNRENKKDLHKYVSQKLQKSKLFKNSSDLLKDVVNDISESAEGLWEWANLVIRSVSHCSTKSQVQRVVKTMPRGINAMLNQELKRLARELSTDMPPDGLADVGESEKIKQLNLIISFVTVAKRPLSVTQLDQILEIILEDEVLNLEQDIGTTYSSLFATRDAGDNKDYLEDDILVTLRHSSFYEFFKLSNNVETGAIHVDRENAEAVFVSVLLHALLNTHTPISNRLINPLETYADEFLPNHMTSAKPEEAGVLQDKISTSIFDLFSEDTKRQRFVTRHYVFTSSYSLRAWSWLTGLAYYYFDAGDYNTANERAQHVLKWLLPAVRERFEESARSMVPPNGICPFTILFSSLVVSVSRHWLQPSNIEPSDGLAHSIPTILNIFGEMAGNLEPAATSGQTGDLNSRPISPVHHPLSASRILLVARLQKFEMTATWHARLAQALFYRDYYKRSLYYFNKALSMNQKNLALSSVTLSVIHRDMASALFEIRRYEDGVHHRRLADNLGGKLTADNFPNPDDYIRHLLEVAQLEYLARLSEQAFAKANDAWQVYLENEEHRDWYLWMDFLSIFLELKQFHRLRSVFELFLQCFQQLSDRDHEADSLARTILNGCTWRLRTLYKAIHFGLTSADKDCLQLMARAVDGPPQPRFALFKLNLFIGTALLEKGQVTTGIRMLCKAVSMPKLDSVHWQSDYAREQALSNLAAICLYHPEISLGVESPLELDVDAESSDICLVISSWLLEKGDRGNARKALCGRVKSCLQLLSDDDPTNDGDAWLELFKTLLADLDSDEDMSGALYMLKTWRRTSSNYEIPESSDDYEDVDESVEIEIEDDMTLERCLAEEKKTSQPKKEEDVVDDVVWFVEGSRTLRGFGESYTACPNCDLQVTSVSDWYFCRSCPHIVLCPSCYGDIGSDSVKNFLSQHAPQTCNSQHDFYYTGKQLRFSECEELGKIRLTSSDSGEVKTLWIEEWKDKLAEKWGTKDFEFEGGLSAWCMKVLPEPQRERWASLFKA